MPEMAVSTRKPDSGFEPLRQLVEFIPLIASRVEQGQDAQAIGDGGDAP